MNPSELKKLRKKLPTRYGVVIAQMMGLDKNYRTTVTRVLHGEITNPEISDPILEAAAKLVEKGKKINSKIRKALKPV